jgi:excisionase family DNA binding protein
MKFLTLREVRSMLQVSDPVLREFIRAGKLQVVQVGPRSLRVPESSLIALTSPSPPKRRRRQAAEVAP